MAELFKDLDPSVISALELNEEKIVTALSQTMHENGAGAYRHHKSSSSRLVQVFVPGKVNAFDITVDEGDISEVPRILLHKWGEIREAQMKANHALAQLAEMGIREYILGVGETAMAFSDFKTAINAYDLTTDGGIINNAEIINALKKYTQDQIDKGEVDNAFAIAQLLQKKVTARAETTSS